MIRERAIDMKKALVTGASGEIGQAIVQVLKHEYEIYAHTFQNSERLKRKFPVELAKSSIHIVQADLSLQSGCDKILSHLSTDIDLIVLCAGCEHYELFTDTTSEQYERMTEIHLLNPMKLVQGLLDGMITRKSGNIIFVSSIWGQVGASCEVLYATLKGAQNAFVKSLAKEVAPLNIRVNAVMPGVVDTRMISNFSIEDRKMMEEEIPMGRFARPEEVANAIYFLTTSNSSYITGTILPITGGWYIT